MNTLVADPHWGWWIIWYFYLGGIAAGAYFMAALIAFVGDEQDRKLGRVGYLLAAPLVAVCGVLLILDLDRPERFWHMLFDAETFLPHMKYWSPMSIGAWALLLFGAISTLSFVGALAELRAGCVQRTNPGDVGTAGAFHAPYWPARLHHGVFGRVFDVCGTVCGFFIASYTGALLTATNQPVWSDSPWIAAMYLASSATTGMAAMRLAGTPGGRVGEACWTRLDRVESWALGLEICTILLFLASQRTSGLPLFELPPIWWLLVGALGLGAFVPLLLRLQPLLLGRRSVVLSALLVLAGGFVMRYAVLATAPAAREHRLPLRIEQFDATDARAGRAVIDASIADQDNLWSAVRDRLELMRDVAWYKQQHELPVEDAERERRLVAAFRAAAAEREVDADAAELLMLAQIVAAKRVQRAWLARWADTGELPLGEAPDLDSVLRPRLDELSRRLLDAFARCRGAAWQPQDNAAAREHGERRLGGVQLGPAERAELIDAVVASLDRR